MLSNDGVSIERSSYADSVQRLAWIIEVNASIEEDYTRTKYDADVAAGIIEPGAHRIVWVDAHTGEVYQTDGFLGGGAANASGSLKPINPAPRPLRNHLVSLPKARLSINGQIVSTCFSPVVIDGMPFLNVRNLSMVGLAVKWASKQIVISGLHSAELIPGSTSGKLDGKMVKFSRPVKMLFDRAYIPLDLMNLLSGNAFKWDKQSRTLDIRKPNTVKTSGH